MPSVQFHDVSTGPIDGDFPFRCAHCGAETMARVRTHGRGDSFSIYGIGRDDALATRIAYRDANRRAVSALFRAPCLGCGRLNPALEERLPKLALRAKNRTRRSIPIAVIAGLVAFGLVAIAYRAELATSTAPRLIAFGFAMLAGGGAFLLAGWPVSAPDFSKPAPVSFWWNTPHGPGWIEAALPSPVPHIPRYGTVTYLLVAIAMVFGVGSMFVGWIGEVGTKRSAHVVLTAPERGPLLVRVDGKPALRIEPDAKNGVLPYDVAFDTIDMRVGRTVRIELEREREPGTTRAITLSPTEADRDWLIAPDAEQSDFCLIATRRVSVGSSPEKPSDAIERLTLEDDVVATKGIYLDFLHPAAEQPAAEKKPIVSFESGLRAVSCAGLAEGSLVPYRSAHGAR